MEVAQAAEHRRVDLGRRRLGTVDTGEHLLVRDIEPAFEHVHLGIAKARQLGVGKAAEHEIHLADAAMTAAEQETAPARVQTFARQVGQGSTPTPKTRTGPGGVYIGPSDGRVIAKRTVMAALVAAIHAFLD